MILVVAVVAAWLLISPIKMFSLKFKGFSLKNLANRLRYAFLLVGAVVVILGGLGSIWAVIILYILISLARMIAGGCKAKK